MTLASVTSPGSSGVPQRPAWHFVPPSGWMNDPNGLVHDGDRYHLFYQHNPTDTVWGNIHWGHATSRDLVTWRHHGTALWPDENGLPFSGCVVERESEWIAVYTADRDGEQTQCLATSNDRGETWRTHSRNPVLPRPAGAPVDFRDPKVVRVDDGAAAGPWMMLLAVGSEIWLYRSPDLLDWTRVGSYRPLPERPGIVIEVPDIARLRVDDGTEADVLFFSVIPAADEPPKRSVFFQVGDLTAAGFAPSEPVGVVDTGPSFYAAVCWPRRADGSTVMIGWMNETPIVAQRGGGWCGRQSIVRGLSLRRGPDGCHLEQTPVLPPLRDRTVSVTAGPNAIPLVEPALVTIPIQPGLEIELGSFRANIDATPSTRARLSSIDGDGELDLANGSLLRLVIDAGSVEVFGADGCAASFITDVDLPGHLTVDAPAASQMILSGSGTP